MRGTFLAVLAVLILSSVLGVPASDAASRCDGNNYLCPESEADEATDAVVTKGVQFPGVSADSALGRATAENADCPECEWTISPACVMNEPGEDAFCADAVNACGVQGEVRFRVYMRVPPAAWELVDTVCLGPGERPTSVADVGDAVRELVVNYLPDASPSFQPAQGGLVNLPTIFAAGEPASIRTEAFDVLGFEVVVTASARWEWTFERGATESFTEPGGVYPDRSVAHTYDRAGARDVSVTTYWKALFTVNGDGPFAVPGPEISKTVGPIGVPVREARSQLVRG